MNNNNNDDSNINKTKSDDKRTRLKYITKQLFYANIFVYYMESMCLLYDQIKTNLNDLFVLKESFNGTKKKPKLRDNMPAEFCLKPIKNSS